MTENESERILVSMPLKFKEWWDKICEETNLKRSEWVRRKIDEDRVLLNIGGFDFESE